MEATKGNWENSKNEAEFALRLLIAVRSKEQPSLHVLQRKVDELKKKLLILVLPKGPCWKRAQVN